MFCSFIKNVKYIPVRSAPETLEINRPIVPKTTNKTHTFTVGKNTYIPLSVVPKVFAPIFCNKKIPVNNKTLTNTVI